MYIATSKQLKRYDQALLDYGYSIEELVDKASDCLIKHFHHYRKVMIVCGPGNNGADGISLGIKLFKEGKDADEVKKIVEGGLSETRVVVRQLIMLN